MDTAQSGEQRCCIISHIGARVVLVSKRRGNRGHDASHLLFHQHRIGRSLPHEPTPSLCLYAREHISSGEWRRRMHLYASESSPLSSRKEFTLNSVRPRRKSIPPGACQHRSGLTTASELFRSVLFPKQSRLTTVLATYLAPPTYRQVWEAGQQCSGLLTTSELLRPVIVFKPYLLSLLGFGLVEDRHLSQ